MEILKVENLCKRYGEKDTEVVALDNVSFTVERGEFVAIIGASGSGKSTLLHLIADKLAIFRRRQVGLIYQFYNLIPILNVVENITLPCRLDGKEVKEERLEELLEILNLKNRKEHLPNQLSGGQQQRVSIGRAIVNYPAIVLADEPTGNLDSKASREIIDLLKMSNQKYNQTVIVITHDENIALEADRILTIDDGKIVKDERVR